MNSGGRVILYGIAGGVFAGAVGGAAGSDSNHPILKGALVAGLVNGVLSSIIVAAQPDPYPLQSGNVNGALASHNPRWP